MRAFALVALALVPTAVAAPPTHVIDTGVVGSYRVEQPRSRALDVFGAPTMSVDVQAENLPQADRLRCRTYWRRLELLIEHSNECASPGRFRRISVRGELWRTRQGLRVGDSLRRLTRLYPGARLTPIPSPTLSERLGFAPLGREWDLRRARPASDVIVATRGNLVVGFELRPASLR